MQVRSSRVVLSNIALATTICALALGALVAYSGAATPAPAPAAKAGPHAIATIHVLTLEGAEQAIHAAHAEAVKRSAGGAIAVVDAGGHLIALHRLDNTFPAASTVAIEKARTAAMFRKPTAAFEDAIKDGRHALLGVQAMTPLRGGVPIMHDGFVVGAIGVSGAHSAMEDEELANVGAAALQASN